MNRTFFSPHRWSPAALALAWAVAPLAGTAGPVAELEGPAGGWRHSGLSSELERYTAAYPKPPVDRGAQKYRTLIEGRLHRAGKEGRKPPTLVVNGNAMPLYADEQGRFARPWAFGRGSNSVEIISADGASRQRLQFYEADATKVQARLRAVLTWDDPKAEVDLHVISPDGGHAFWASPLLPAGGGLDVDSVDGAGPEIFSSAAPRPGVWLFYVNYWGNFDAAGYNFQAGANARDLITARLTLIYNENTLNEKRETLVVPLRKLGELTLMKSVRF
ncbi:YfaP family protein [Cupriavidus sp. 2TAF22]|uniref:YfaP family protein n=1 Tax=unclassified Cupriavidus TaxID=2640874 RepID=UPI003F9263A1